MRGMFTAGVTDVLMEAGVEPQGAVGVSAGATFGCNYKSRQIGRALRYNKRFCADPRYGSMRSFLHSGDVFDVEFCYDIIPNELDPFDSETFASSPMEFYVVATNAHTGGPEYHRCTDGGENDLQWIRASASIPLASRIVELEGMDLVDGGVADSIPLEFMEGCGYEHNIVILTQPADFEKKRYKEMPLFRATLRKYPSLVQALNYRHLRYNAQTAYVRDREREGMAFVFRPPAPLDISPLTNKPQELQRVYDIGRTEAEARLSELTEWLAQ